MNSTTTVCEPGSFRALTVETAELYDSMVDAHRHAAEAAAYHTQQTLAWIDAGQPVVDGPLGQPKADGYFVLAPMTIDSLNTYLVKQLERIKFVGSARNYFFELSYDEYTEFVTPKYKFKS